MVPPKVASVVLRNGGASVTVTVVFSPPTVSFKVNPNMEALSTVTFSCSSL